MFHPDGGCPVYELGRRRRRLGQQEEAEERRRADPWETQLDTLIQQQLDFISNNGLSMNDFQPMCTGSCLVVMGVSNVCEESYVENTMPKCDSSCCDGGTGSCSPMCETMGGSCCGSTSKNEDEDDGGSKTMLFIAVVGGILVAMVLAIGIYSLCDSEKLGRLSSRETKTEVALASTMEMATGGGTTTGGGEWGEVDSPPDSPRPDSPSVINMTGKGKTKW